MQQCRTSTGVGRREQMSERERSALSTRQCSRDGAEGAHPGERQAPGWRESVGHIIKDDS